MSLGYKCNALCFHKVFYAHAFGCLCFKKQKILRKRKIDDVDGGVSKKQKKEDEKLELKLKV